MSEPCDGCHADATHFLCDECLGEDEQDKLRAEVERLREALTQSNRYIDEAVKKRTLRYDEAVAKYGVRSPEAREQSKLLHDLINGTRNSFDSTHRALAALAVSEPVETRTETPERIARRIESLLSTPCATPDFLEGVRRAAPSETRRHDAYEVVVEKLRACKAERRALAERVREACATEAGAAVRSNSESAVVVAAVRALDLDALLEEP